MGLILSVAPAANYLLTLCTTAPQVAYLSCPRASQCKRSCTPATTVYVFVCRCTVASGRVGCFGRLSYVTGKNKSWIEKGTASVHVAKLQGYTTPPSFIPGELTKNNFVLFYCFTTTARRKIKIVCSWCSLFWIYSSLSRPVLFMSLGSLKSNLQSPCKRWLAVLRFLFLEKGELGLMRPWRFWLQVQKFPEFSVNHTARDWVKCCSPFLTSTLSMIQNNCCYRI